MKIIKLYLENKLIRILSIYIFSIFVFAGIYSGLSANSFYHSTIQYEESSFNKDVFNTSPELEESLLESIIENLSEGSIIQFFHVNSITFKDYPEKIKINYHIQIEKENTLGTKDVLGFMDSVDLNLQSLMSIDGEVYVSYVQDRKNESFAKNINSYINYETLFDSQITGFVHIKKEVYSKLLGIGNAYIGFPKKLSGQYLRMLYLSIGVATTMTFGDILPVTTLARILIMIQNFITLVFLGFLIEAFVDLINKKT